MAQEDRLDKLRELGLLGGQQTTLEDIVNRHSILLGKLAGDPYIGNILMGFSGDNIGEILSATSTSPLTLTTSLQDIPGATITLSTSGVWAVTGVFDMQSEGAGDDNFPAIGGLDVDGDARSEQAVYILRATSPVRRASISQVWRVATTSPKVVLKLQAQKASGSGTSKIGSPGTTIVAIRAR